MINFKLFKNGLYLSSADPSKACVAFLFQDAARTDPTFQLSQSTWTDPNQQGYFAFFVPSATRDWDAFATAVRGLFQGTQGAQFGWFQESGPNVTANTLVLTGGQGTSSPFVSQSFTLVFNSITLAVTGSPIPTLRPNISFDDGSNSFVFNNATRNTQLTSAPPSQSQSNSFAPVSDSTTLPMDDGTNVHAGSVNLPFQFVANGPNNDLSWFEAGFMYFGPGANNLLTALSYPLLCAPGGAQTPLNFSVWLDVLQPLVDTRSYFQATDATVGSYYTTANGKSFALTTVNGADPALTSRLAFANRPVNQPSDQGKYYYLTPAGAFGVIVDGSTPAGGSLLCGVTGTEFLNVQAASAAASAAVDSLVMKTGQPAFQKTTPSTSWDKPPVFLDSMNGNVTTSWVQFVTAEGQYISQPQESPLFDQSGQSAAMLSGASPESGLSVYVLDFLPVPAWSAKGKSNALAAASSPLVPMVPYAGLTLTTQDEYKPFLAMESTALNPTRKNNFTGAQSSANKLARASGALVHAAFAPGDELKWAMTPQGLLAGLDTNQVWQSTRIGLSPDLKLPPPAGVILQFTNMGDAVREALMQNQIFLVISSLTAPDGSKLFDFAGPDQTVNIAGWPFSLSPDLTRSAGDPQVPPIVILKFFPGQSISSLVGDISLWSQAATFNTSTDFTAEQAQTYIQGVIQSACEAVYGAGNCPDGTPSGPPDTTSLYYNFYQVVTNPNFSGMLALNCNMQLESLPTAIKAVTGGMTVPGANPGDPPVSNIDAFRVHHVGVSINDTEPGSTTPTLAQSSFFGLVDYEKPEPEKSLAVTAVPGLTVNYNFEVQYLRALFTNSSLSSFSCKVNLTVNELFGTEVTEEKDDGGTEAEGDDDNIIIIIGSYQAHSTSGDDSSSGEGVYSFVAEKTYTFKFDDNTYLEEIELTKLQFSFQQETVSPTDSTTSNIQAGFGIWGSMTFKDFNVLDIFSFEKLSFNDLGISVSFDLTVNPPASPKTANLQLDFNPGNLRLDLANSPPKEGTKNALLKLLPFKLTSFLYNQYPDQQTLENLGYFSLSGVPLDTGYSLTDQFNYGLAFDLDLGTLGALVGSLQAFKFSFLIGWLQPGTGVPGGIAFGVQLPQADGKLEIKIQGVLDLIIEQFILRYQTPTDGGDAMLVLALHNSSIEILGQRLPPGTAQFDFALFAPINDAAHIGWIAAVNNEPEAVVERKLLAAGDRGNHLLVDAAGDDDGGTVFKLMYLGLGQRVGPDPTTPPTTFKEFLDFMKDDFWKAIEDSEYDKVYHPDGQWIALTDFTLLEKITVGFVFYDVTPFYSLTLSVEKLFDFEITYTKISDSIGLFYAVLTLPESLRTFQVGAASLTLPSLAVSVYTNGDWKVDLGFPNGDDWSGCFRVQAQAGPIPVTGSGGFYIASLSSATSSIFTGTYPSILAFGFAVRLGVGKDFTAGPLKAGVSITFFGIVQGAAGYLASGSDNIFQSPDALMLTGQFGVIGELYGKIDFVIIKASVNVRLQASIGIVLKMERTIPGSGSILLYIEASVSVSVSVEINLFLFSITISFSFNASFRFEWQLLSPGSPSALLEMKQSLLASRSLLASAPSVLPLIPGFTTSLPIWYLPEGTVVFPASTGTGTPWVVSSLGAEYNNSPSGTPDYSTFKPFEKLTTQLATWAVGQALGLSGWNFTVTEVQLQYLDQNPTSIENPAASLVGWIDYLTLLSQLAVFSSTTVAVPQAPSGTTLYAATFPMPPFFKMQTTGRMNGTTPDDLGYVFSIQNNVPATYIATVDDYFNQMFVNQEGASSGGALTATLAAADATIPLIQEIFLNYFTGLIRGAVHQLLQTIQNLGVPQAAINTLVSTAVGNGLFASLGGQMSSSFRGGTRLPYTAGLTVPGGTALTTTNPQYALLWQEFPVGSLGASNKYTIALSNPDTTQTWITSTASWDLTSSWLQPLQQAQATDIQSPSAPQQMPFTDIGPQAFSFDNPVPWTQPSSSVVSLRPYASALQRLQAAGTDISVLVESRLAGAPYMPGGTPLSPAAFSWATQITLNVTQVPAGAGGSLPDVFTLAGSSQSDQQLLEQILQVLQNEQPISSIQILYQTAAGSTGLTSDSINASDVFVLRTNTTTQSAPPPGGPLTMLAAAQAPPPVPVGAQIDDVTGFLQIIQQAAVTNATGYYLRYLNQAGKSLPPTLFSGGPAPLTILISFLPTGEQNTPASPARIRPFYNSVVLNSADATLVYYAETTNPAYSIQYGTVAAGSIGAVMTRDDSAMMMRPSPTLLRSAASIEGNRHYRQSEVIKALVDSGITDEDELRSMLAASGSNASQLNALYSLITYQVAATSGFVLGNLSAPVQPQQPTTDSSAADGVTNATASTRSYRTYVPLYNVATANQPLGPSPNRYASIGSPVSINFFQNDAFGNQMPAPVNFSGVNNYYFDPIVALDQWQGLVTNYDCIPSGPTANTFNVYLTPSQSAFEQLTADQAAAALTAWTTIYDQITAPGISFNVETNLALNSDGSMVTVTLSQQQATAITTMAASIIAYLKNPVPPFNVPPVVLTLSVTGAGALPPAFEIAMLFQIQRDPSLISPMLKDGSGNITFPSAQRATTTVVSTVGASVGGNATVSVTDFAAVFVKAFPQLVLSVGLNGAQSLSQNSSVARSRSLLQQAGVAADGSGSGKGGNQSLWAVQKSLLSITIGGPGAGPFYLSPEPLDNTLNSAVVPMPSIPAALKPPPTWSDTQLFTDVDLDRLNSTFFQAVDTFLAPASASKAFEVARPAYDAAADGRATLASLYSLRELDWLFPADSPFTKTGTELSAAQETFEQQMRAALATAYTTDTVVQYGVNWGTLPAGIGDSFALFGTINATLPPAGTPSCSGTPIIEDDLRGYTFSSPTVPITPSGPSLLTFLFGVSDVRDTKCVTLSLAYNVTHLQYFLVPSGSVPPGEARPSMWLQLVNPYATPPPLGSGVTNIPLVFREYPTPPTVILQEAAQPSIPPVTDNPLMDAAAWQLTYAYQVQLTVHDMILTAITYNTNLTTSSGGGQNNTALAAGDVQRYTLFESLARFSATFPVILPVLTNLADPNWSVAAGLFADLVTAVVTNTTWTPLPTAFAVGRPLPNITDTYTVTDVPQGTAGAQIITFEWETQQSSFPGVTLSIEALAPANPSARPPTPMQPYPNQFTGTVPNGITNTYTPVPPLADDWVIHQIEADKLNVLFAENALAGLQIERNLIEMTAPDNTAWYAKPEYVYMTPIVRATQPITPFVDNSVPINIATLPNQGIGTGCPSAPPPGVGSLCQRIYTMMYDLLADDDTQQKLLSAKADAGLDASTPRRVKVACSFQYPVSTPGGVVSANPVSPLVPVALARSFLIDATQPSQLSDFSGIYATAVANWAADNAITLGAGSLAGAQFVFDITLFAQLSGLNTPVLRLRNLQLKLTDVATP